MPKTHDSKKRKLETEETTEDIEVTKEKKEKKEKKDKKSKSSAKPKRSLEENVDEYEGALEYDEAVPVEETENNPEDDESDPGAFSNFRICSETVELLTKRGITSLFPIQYNTFDSVFDGKDIVAKARTGTGKTFSFAIPIVEKIKANKLGGKDRGRSPIVLVMAPTRELAKQVAGDFECIAPSLSVATFYGGVSYDEQNRVLRNGLDILVGTPGRIIDHLESGKLQLNNIKFVVLDEADQMLDIGFAQDMETILSKIPKESDHQTCLFSATVPKWISQVAVKYLKKGYTTVDLVGDDEVKSSEKIQHFAMQTSFGQGLEIETLADVIKVYGGTGRVIVFADKKADVTRITTAISSLCQGISGDVEQRQREITLKGFKEGKFKCLVATDVAARGIDIPDVELVIQMSPPGKTETYIHRVGRTGRAGKTGKGIILYTPRSAYDIERIEKHVGIKFKRLGAPQPSDMIRAAAETSRDLLDKVHPSVADHFMDTALKIIEERGAQESLARAMAYMCGFINEIEPKSLIEGRKGFLTIKMSNTTLRYVTGVFTHFEKSNVPRDNIKAIRFTTSGDILIDVLAEDAKRLVEESKVLEGRVRGRDVGNKIELCETLDGIEFLHQPGSSGRGGSGYGNGGRGGYGNRRGGYGNSGRGGYGNGGSRGGYGNRNNNSFDGGYGKGPSYKKTKYEN